MDSLNKLTEYFREFPGIGPRQARRFAYFLLTKSPSFADELARLVIEIKKSMRVCDMCFCFYAEKKENRGGSAGAGNLCAICSNNQRNRAELIIVARDIDLEAIEKSGTYNGLYFVLGGTVPILEKLPETRIRSRELLARMENQKTTETNSMIKEIILSLSATPEGEHTEEILRSLLRPNAEKHGIKITVLGRGLSTGAELEYSDADTIKNALKNRT